MIMPGRSWVAGIDIAGLHLLRLLRLLGILGSRLRLGTPTGPLLARRNGVAGLPQYFGPNSLFYTEAEGCGNGECHY